MEQKLLQKIHKEAMRDFVRKIKGDIADEEDIDEANRIIYILREDLRQSKIRFWTTFTVVIFLLGIIIINCLR